MKQTILVFGASMTWGAWDEEGGWVSRLRRFEDKKNISGTDYYCKVYNLGVSGDNTNDLLERFENEVKGRITEGGDTIIIFSIGANDSLSLKSDVAVPIEQFKENIKKLIKKAGEFTNEIFFVGLTKVDESKTQPVAWDKTAYYSNDRLKEYDSALENIAKKEEEVSYLNIFDLLDEGDLEDGLHPNSKGHEKIFQEVRAFLIKNKIIK